MNNIIFFDSSSDLENLVQRVRSKKKYNKVIYISTSKYADYHLHEFDYSIPKNYTYRYFSKNIYDELYKKIFLFIKLRSRCYRPYNQDSYSSYTIHEQINCFNMLVEFFSQILIKNDIKIIIFSRIFHLSTDFILYYVAKALGIKTLLFTQSIFENTFFYMTDIEDIGKHTTIPCHLPHVANTPQIGKGANDAWKESKQKFLKMITSFKQRHFGINLLKVKKSFPHLYMKSWIQEFCHIIIQYDKRKEYQKNYNNSVTKYKDINLDTDFIYFALHLQPELTTNPLGYEYDDQLLAIERLSSIVPENWKIYVKENPIQGYYQRDPFFFERLKKIKNIILVEKTFDTMTLIKKSKFVATITGSVGYEAVCEDKPALIFANTWYSSLPGVCMYHEGISVEDIMGQNIVHEDIQSTMNEIFSHAGKGVLYEPTPETDKQILEMGYENAIYLINYCLEN